MSDDTVRRFPRLGLVGPAGGPPETAAEAAEEASAAPVSTPDPAPPGGRRSPLESIAAMASPGLSDPVVTAQEHSASAPGHTPGTFRGAGFHEEGQAPQPGLGTLSVAAVLAVAVAAMRGIHGAIAGVRANREQRKAVADLADSGRGDGTSSRKGRVQSAADFGRGFLGRPDRPGSWFRSGGGPGGRGGGRGGSASFGGWGGGSSSRRSSGTGAGAFGGRKAFGSGSGARGGRGGGAGGGRGDRSGAGGPGGSAGRSERESRSGSIWWRGGSKRTSQRGTGSRRSTRGGKDPGAVLFPDRSAGTGGATPTAGGKGRTKSPKAGTAPKGVLRPNKAKESRAAGRGGAAGSSAVPGKANKGGKVGTSPAGKNTAGPKGSSSPTSGGKNSGAAAAAPAGRVTLRQAIGNEFQRRWAERRKHGTPVITTLPTKKRRKAAAKTKGKQRSAATATAAGPKVNLNKNPKANQRKPPKPAGSPPPRPGAAGAGTPGPRPGGPSKHTRHGGGHWSRVQRRAQQRWEQRRAAHAAPDDDFWFVWGPNGMRRTPWQSAGAAAAGVQGAVHTIERLDNVGDQERHFGPKLASTAAAIGPAAPSSSTGRKETGSMSLPDRVMSGLVTGMSSEHATEVTLDDTLETLERLTVESFAAHETSAHLAQEARRIRYALEDLAADLRTRHNVIGRMTATAMERLAESMELLARRAEEMKVASLDAAEMSEAAENAMFDAYKPVQQATVDAGLAVPSARVHNEG